MTKLVDAKFELLVPAGAANLMVIIKAAQARQINNSNEITVVP
jgi:hypothetical protein